MRIIGRHGARHRAENAAGHGCHTPHGGPRERGHVQRRAVPCAGRACAGRIRRLWASLGWRRSAAGLRRAFFWTNRARLAPWCAKMPLPRGLPKGPACCKQAPGPTLPPARRRSTSFCWTRPTAAAPWRPFCPLRRVCWRRAAWCWQRQSAGAQLPEACGALRLAKQYRYGTVLVSKYTLCAGDGQ